MTSKNIEDEIKRLTTERAQNWVGSLPIFTRTLKNTNAPPNTP
jgi:hypothetical protein